jgi:hypothetical protein
LALTKKYQQQKITGNKILLLTGRILATFTKFWLLLPEFGDGGQNRAAMVLPKSCRTGQILAQYSRILIVLVRFWPV